MAKLSNPEPCPTSLEDTASQPNAAAFQAYPGTGDADEPQRLNDNDTGGLSVGFNSAGKYVEVIYGDLVVIKRWRQFGSIGNGGAERFKIQYYDVETDAYVDWVTDIPARTTDDWSGFTTEAEKFTTKIKVIMTTISGPTNELGELEVIY